MEILTVAEFSPSFSRMSPATIDFAVRYGAAKVDNFLSFESAESLHKNGATTIPSLLAHRAPELQTFFDILGVDDEQTDRIVTDRVRVEANTGDIHVDTIAPGLSLLLPVIGDKAIFGANNEPFLPSELPGFVVEYGVRDAIVLRQGLSGVNGDSQNYSWASHVGRADTPREIVTIHCRASELHYDAA